MLEGRRVLVVEDDPQGARLFSVLLTMAGAAVEVVHTAADALAILDRFEPDIILLDLVLPRVSGIVLATMVSSDPRTRHIAIVAVSAFGRDQAEAPARAAGCVGFISKPVDPAGFAAEVARLAQGRE